MYRHKIISALSNIIFADFKTAKKKFLDQGIEDVLIDSYFDNFKTLKDRNKIDSTEDRNIDNWAKKPWEEFVQFIDTLKQEKSKSEEIREMKKEGAELVAEDDNWRVYKITTYEASRTYGSGKWCITRDEKWWKKYSRNQFYFMLSKTRPENDPWHKIALQLTKRGSETYWDAQDKNHKKLPQDLHMVNYDKDFDKGEDFSPVESIISDINGFAQDEYDYMIDPEQNDMTSYLYESDFDLEHVDDDLKERLEVLEKLAEEVGRDYNGLIAESTNVIFDHSYYSNRNEIASINIGDSERELPDEIIEEYEALSEEEQKEVKRGVDTYISNHNTISIGSDSDRFALIIDEDKIEEAIKELSENLKVSKQITPKTDLLALNGKHASTRKLALEKTQNQKVIEKAYLDNDKFIRRLAASKIKNANMLADIAKNTNEENVVRVAAIDNENFTDQAYLKNVVSETPSVSSISELDNYYIRQACFKNITDDKWRSKFVMQPNVSSELRQIFIQALAEKKGAKSAKNYVSYLKSLADLMLKEGQIDYSLAILVKEIPEKEQDFFKKIVLAPSEDHGYGYGITKPSKHIAMEKIKDETFLKRFVVKELKKDKLDENLIAIAIKGINDQEFLTKLLNSKIKKLRDSRTIQLEIVKKIKNEATLVKYLQTSQGFYLTELVEEGRFSSDKAKLVLLTDPNIWAYGKKQLLTVCSEEIISQAFNKIKKSGNKSSEIRDTLRYMADALEKQNQKDSPLYNEIQDYIRETLID